MTRQNLTPFTEEDAAKINLAKGAYILSEDEDFDTVVIATGSEVNTTLEAVRTLRTEGGKFRVVSMPSQELFLKQSSEYRSSIIPPECEKRISVEAATTFGWERFTGEKGLNIGIDHFGAVFERFEEDV